MIDLEIALAKGLGWSLYDIDCTDIHSLMPFVRRFTGQADSAAPAQNKPRQRKMYCDQVNL